MRSGSIMAMQVTIAFRCTSPGTSWAGATTEQASALSEMEDGMNKNDPLAMTGLMWRMIKSLYHTKQSVPHRSPTGQLPSWQALSKQHPLHNTHRACLHAFRPNQAPVCTSFAASHTVTFHVSVSQHRLHSPKAVRNLTSACHEYGMETTVLAAHAYVARHRRFPCSLDLQMTQ